MVKQNVIFGLYMVYTEILHKWLQYNSFSAIKLFLIYSLMQNIFLSAACYSLQFRTFFPKWDMPNELQMLPEAVIIT